PRSDPFPYTTLFRSRRPTRSAKAPPRRQEVTAPPANVAQPRNPVVALGPVDMDRADAAELERLPGIGPALARRIVADREQHGPRSEEHTSELQSREN